MKLKLFTFLLFCSCLVGCNKHTGKAEVLSSAGRTSCEWVQLWENGPKWATFNVGATITNYANLTAGTNTTDGNIPYYNTANVGGLYPWNNPYFNGRISTWGMYVNSDIADVATTLWGSNWESPSQFQWDTLCNFDHDYGKTILVWCDGDTLQYVEGCTLAGWKVTGVGEYAEQSIFLPSTGFYDYKVEKILNADCDLRCWTGYTYFCDVAFCFFYTSYYGFVISSEYHMNGLSVRAILSE